MNPKTLGVASSSSGSRSLDLMSCLLDNTIVRENSDDFRFVTEQSLFLDVSRQASSVAEVAAHKFRLLKVCQSLEARSVDRILIPDFEAYTFLDQLTSELDVPVIDMMVAIREHLATVAAPGDSIGIATSDCVRQSELFERYLSDTYRVIHSSFGARQKSGGSGTAKSALTFSDEVCAEFKRQGASIIVATFSELVAAGSGSTQGVEVVDVHRVYADFAIRFCDDQRKVRFKLGIVGGIGPAATVDFMDKVVRNTVARRDQDHIKMLVEHNPQIPDRTAHLLHQAEDPTLALYATCVRLEAGGASAIALPCNTAHAFVERIQPYLGVPIINMLRETVSYIVDRFGAGCTVGLLATSGTVASRIYHNVSERELDVLTPEPEFQEKVMAAIYGPCGVKAGFTDGKCREDLIAAIKHLSDRGAEVMILGCTELPLIIGQADAFDVGGVSVTIVDPTNVLAQRCVLIANALGN